MTSHIVTVKSQQGSFYTGQRIKRHHGDRQDEESNDWSNHGDPDWLHVTDIQDKDTKRVQGFQPADPIEAGIRTHCARSRGQDSGCALPDDQQRDV